MCKYNISVKKIVRHKILVSGCLIGLWVAGILLPSNTQISFASTTNPFIKNLRLPTSIFGYKKWDKNTCNRKKIVSKPESTTEATTEPTTVLTVEPTVKPSAAASTAPSQTTIPEWDILHSGYATYTGSGYSGGCALLDPISSDMEITALNPADYNSHGVKAALAGAYLEVEGPRGTTTVYVTDLYPEGSEGALDLCPTSFGKIGEISEGKIDIQWHIVKAPITGNLSYRIKEGSNPWWTAIQVRNHKYPVLKMEYYQNGSWINMEKMQWNHFVGTDIGTKSIKIRMTDINGEVVTDTIEPIPEDGVTSAYIVPGTVQFPN